MSHYYIVLFLLPAIVAIPFCFYDVNLLPNVVINFFVPCADLIVRDSYCEHQHQILLTLEKTVTSDLHL